MIILFKYYDSRTHITIIKSNQEHIQDVLRDLKGKSVWQMHWFKATVLGTACVSFGLCDRAWTTSKSALSVKYGAQWKSKRGKCESQCLDNQMYKKYGYNMAEGERRWPPVQMQYAHWKNVLSAHVNNQTSLKTQPSSARWGVQKCQETHQEVKRANKKTPQLPSCGSFMKRIYIEIKG